MALSEFEIIDRYFRPRPPDRPEVVIGVGDDAAILRVPGCRDLAITVDTLVAGTHFSDDAEPEAIGHKALAVSLSDLAAMGAEPLCATLALTLPQADEKWLERFSGGFFHLARRHALDLVGGNISRGPLTVSVTAHGILPEGGALRRIGAQPGDAIFVTGSLGDAALALEALGGSHPEIAPYTDYLRTRLHRPAPRVAQGVLLRSLASSAIDVSDGLATDLGHILAANAVGAVIELDRLPRSSALQALPELPRQWELALGGGEDYELCFTVPEIQADKLGPDLGGVWITRIGQIQRREGLRFIDPRGTAFVPRFHGFRHF
ncbi:MAG: thiamine-phosphate kinase [Pseudomonadota bacterium]|nr:thiamine-phosphate kinase [Pseudomonadota bacterium]